MNGAELAARLQLQPQASVRVARADGDTPEQVEERHVLFNAEANAWVIDQTQGQPKPYLSLAEYDKIEAEVIESLKQMRQIVTGIAERKSSTT